MDLQELAQVVPKHVCDWEVNQVSHWLEYISLPHLAKSFSSHQIQGWRLLLLTEEELTDKLKVKSKIQRKKLLNWISFLSDNSRLLHSLLKDVQCVQLTDAEDNLEASTATNSQFSKQLEGTEDTVNWGQFGSTQKGRFTFGNHLNLYLYERFRGQNRFFSCNRGRNITIGKAADNIICILEPTIDLYHCSIIHKQHNHYIKPGSSPSGVWVKIKNILPLDHTYVIEMGETMFIVAQDNDFLTLSAFDGFDPNSNYDCYSYPPEQGTVRVGRSLNYELSFSYDSTMSSLHGKFTFIDGIWYFQDLLTTNGSWFRCSGDTLISDKSTFRIGRSAFVFDCKLLESDDGTSISSVQSRGICRVCNTAEKNSYFTPCCHSNSCLECAVHTSRCIQCHASIAQIHKMYR